MRAAVLAMALLMAPTVKSLEVVLHLPKAAAMERVVGAFVAEGVTAERAEGATYTSAPVHLKVLFVDDVIVFHATLFEQDSSTHVILTVTHSDVGTADAVAVMDRNGARQEAVEQPQTIDSHTHGKLHEYWNQMQRVATRLEQT